jgi:hypothetical protein
MNTEEECKLILKVEPGYMLKLGVEELLQQSASTIKYQTFAVNLQEKGEDHFQQPQMTSSDQGKSFIFTNDLNVKFLVSGGGSSQLQSFVFQALTGATPASDADLNSRPKSLHVRFRLQYLVMNP